MPTDYAVSAALRARLMGAFLVLVGVLVFVATASVFLLRLPLDVLSVVIVVVLLAVVGVGYVLNRGSYVVRADEEGYRVRLVRGVGARSARWTEVQDVVATRVGGDRCVVLRLRDGRSSTVPVDLLAMDGDDFVRALQGHLDAGNGYRRGASGPPGSRGPTPRG